MMQDICAPVCCVSDYELGDKQLPGGDITVVMLTRTEMHLLIARRPRGCEAISMHNLQSPLFAATQGVGRILSV